MHCVLLFSAVEERTQARKRQIEDDSGENNNKKSTSAYTFL